MKLIFKKIKTIFSNKRFVVITTQRSGSTLLAEYLNSHQNIEMGYELFKVEKEGYNADKRGYRDFQGSIENYLDQFYSQGLRGHKASGFKIMLDQIHKYPEILNYIKKNRIKCIYLERENILDTAISRLTARKRKLHHIHNSVKLDKIVIDIELLHKELEKIDKELKELRELLSSLKHIAITYRKLTEDKNNTLDKIFSFLNVQNIDGIHAKVKKINDKELKNIVENYNEVCHYLQHSKYQQYLPQSINTSSSMNLHDRYNAIFVHIPKVAGSSIEKALYATKGKVSHQTAQEYKKYDQLKFEKYFKFAFVRNPYDRFVSAYEYLRQGGRNEYDKAWAEKHILVHDSFKSFVLSLNNEQHRKEILSWMHFKPQYYFVCDEDKKILVDFIGRYENIKDDFKYITKQLSLSATLPHENKTVQRKDYHHYYDEETIQVIYRVYQIDFELFNYTVL